MAVSILISGNCGPYSSGVGQSAQPSVTATQTVAGQAVGPQASGSTRPRTRVQTTAAGVLPKEFLYVESSEKGESALWLIDLTGSTTPTAVARWTLGTGTSSVSADGRTAIVEERASGSVTGLYLVHPLTGDASTLYEAPVADGRTIYPQLSPDGKRFAFVLGREHGFDGLWVGTVADGLAHQLLPQPYPEDLSVGPVLPFGWSDDSRSVIYSAAAAPDPYPKVWVHDVITDRRFAVGEASLVSWRPTEPHLVMAFVGGKGNQGAFGATVSTYDVAQHHRTELLSIGPRVTELAWSPTNDEFLFLQNETGCRYRATIWAAQTDGTTRRVGALDTIDQAWWSADGRTIYALVRPKGEDARLVDAQTLREIARVPQDEPFAGCP